MQYELPFYHPGQVSYFFLKTNFTFTYHKKQISLLFCFWILYLEVSSQWCLYGHAYPHTQTSFSWHATVEWGRIVKMIWLEHYRCRMHLFLFLASNAFETVKWCVLLTFLLFVAKMYLNTFININELVHAKMWTICMTYCCISLCQAWCCLIYLHTIRICSVVMGW
jgi:hypothetical protein